MRMEQLAKLREAESDKEYIKQCRGAHLSGETICVCVCLLTAWKIMMDETFGNKKEKVHVMSSKIYKYT